jgi:hypothetical protein
VLCTDDVYSAELGLIQGEEKGKDRLPKGRAPIYVLTCISRSEVKRGKRDERWNGRAVPGCALSARVTGWGPLECGS